MSTLPTGSPPSVRVSSSEPIARVAAVASVPAVTALPLQPGGGQGSDPIAEAMFNLLVDAAGEAEAHTPDTAHGPTSGAMPGQMPGARGFPAPTNGAGLPMTPPEDGAAHPPGSPPSLPSLPSASVSFGASPAGAMALAAPAVGVDSPKLPDAASSPISCQPFNASSAPAASQPAMDRAATTSAAMLPPASAIASGSEAAAAQPANAAPVVTQIGMPPVGWQPLQSADKPKPWHPRRDEGDAYDENLAADDDTEDDTEEQADSDEPQPPVLPEAQAASSATDLQAMKAPHGEMAVAGLFDQLCEALEQRAKQGPGDEAVHLVLAELSRRRRVVVVSPDRVVQGRRVPAHVDVLCPEQRGGVAVRLSGELTWKEEGGERVWASAHVFKSQSPSGGNQFQPVEGSVGTHQVMIALASQSIPAQTWSNACVRIADANRLWQMLSHQWSLRVVISPEPLFIHRYSP